jgi:hypothetical protein
MECADMALIKTSLQGEEILNTRCVTNETDHVTFIKKPIKEAKFKNLHLTVKKFQHMHGRLDDQA